MPVFHECQRCTACCRWPGQVPLSDESIVRMANHLGVREFDFVQDYAELNAPRTGLVLKNHASGACILLDGGDCRVNPVKPQQCRDFPNLWNFPGFEKICKARPREVSSEEFRKLIAEATGREGDIPQVMIVGNPLETAKS